MDLKKDSRCALLRSLGLVLAVLAFGLTGCTLPDVSPFTASTTELRGAIVSTGATVEGELNAIDTDALDASQKARLKQSITDFKAAWEERVRVFDAMVAYANSLQEVVDSGNEGEASAKKLAGAVTDLAKVAGIAVPGSGDAAEVVTETAAFVYGQIAKARAAKRLGVALKELNPAVIRIADVIAGKPPAADGGPDPQADKSNDLQDIRELIIASTVWQRSQLKRSMQGQLNYRNKFVAEREEAFKKIAAALDNGTAPSQLNTADLEVSEERIRQCDEWYQPYLEQRQAIDKNEKQALALIDETQAAVRTWAAAHMKLKLAVENDRAVNVQELAAAASRVRQLINKINDL